MNNLRFISESDYKELLEYYHLARIQHSKKYDRMLLACKWFHKEHPTISETAAYKDLSANLEGY